MAAKVNDDLFSTLRAQGVRKKVAKQVAAIDGNKSRAGAKGQKVARQTIDDLTQAADTIHKHVVQTPRGRGKAARKAADTRRRNAAKRSAAAKKAAKTRRATRTATARAKSRARRS